MTKTFLIFANPKTKQLSVAQLVEQLTLNQWVVGSIPAGETITGCSAVGSVPRSGRGGRKFESSHPDKRT